MIALDKSVRSRQDRVWIDSHDYLIHTDFCYWIAFSKKFELMEKEGVNSFNLYELDYLYKIIKLGDQEYGIPENREAGYKELCKFFRNDQPLPHSVGKQSNVKAVDWLIDSEYINCAFIQQYGIDLIKADLHWHDFLSLFNGLRETKLTDIISARYYSKSKKPKSYDPMDEMRLSWELESLAVFKKKLFVPK